jgi:hypothetical protein
MAGVHKLAAKIAGRQGVSYYHCSKQLQGLASKGGTEENGVNAELERLQMFNISYIYSICPLAITGHQICKNAAISFSFALNSSCFHIINTCHEGDSE